MNMHPRHLNIRYIDRLTGKLQEEKAFGEAPLRFLYGRGWFGKIFGPPLKFLISYCSLFSALFGWWQKRSFTKRYIQPFIQQFGLDTTEFLHPVESYRSFDDFFTRKLKPEARPITGGEGVAIIPADGRYLFYPNISLADGFLVKGEKFHLEKLLKSPQLASEYDRGSMVISRLCPSDYHRYHFPIDGIPGETRIINGPLFSVNPIAIRQDIHIFTKNKRAVCELKTDPFGKVLFVEVGATNVGSINQVYTPHHHYRKGDEKGYFSFGASTIILFFEPGRITFDEDLVKASSKKIEIKCLMGQRLGVMPAE